MNPLANAEEYSNINCVMCTQANMTGCAAKHVSLTQQLRSQLEKYIFLSFISGHMMSLERLTLLENVYPEQYV